MRRKRRERRRKDGQKKGAERKEGTGETLATQCQKKLEKTKTLILPKNGCGPATPLRVTKNA